MPHLQCSVILVCQCLCRGSLARRRTSIARHYSSSTSPYAHVGICLPGFPTRSSSGGQSVVLCVQTTPVSCCWSSSTPGMRPCSVRRRLAASSSARSSVMVYMPINGLWQWYLIGQYIWSMRNMHRLVPQETHRLPTRP